jgi:hypothetical protein
VVTLYCAAASVIESKKALNVMSGLNTSAILKISGTTSLRSSSHLPERRQIIADSGGIAFRTGNIHFARASPA